jgi:RHS repeat-associated protein
LGNVAKRYDYLPFGVELFAGTNGRSAGIGYTSSGDGFSPKFTGMNRDVETGLDYFNARYYSAAQGRFTSPDPGNAGANVADPQTWNGYAYVNNSPLNYTDPTGEFAIAAAFPLFKILIGLGAGGAGGIAGGLLAAQGGSSGLGTLAGSVAGGGSGPTFSTTGWCVGCLGSRGISAPWVMAGGSATTAAITPWAVGWEWLTGTGPRSRAFTDGDHFAELLRKHSHIQNLVKDVCNGTLPPNGRAPYSLSGLQGVPKYIGDYSTLATGGRTGNLAVTYLGSYNVSYSTSGGVLNMQITNASTISSATHPPVVGYTQWWSNNIGGPLDRFFSSGPLSKTTQSFSLHENLTARRCKGF